MKGVLYVIDKLGETLGFTEQALAEAQQALQVAEARIAELEAVPAKKASASGRD